MERPGMAQTQSEKTPNPAQQTGPASPERDPAGSKNEQNAGSDSDPIAMLRADHRRVEQLFGSFEKASSAEQKSQLAKQICTELTIHTLIEEEIFYPACHANMEQRLLDEAQVEHDGAKALIIEITAGSPDDQYFSSQGEGIVGGHQTPRAGRGETGHRHFRQSQGGRQYLHLGLKN